MTLEWWDDTVYITFTLYLILVLGIGFAAYFATRNFDDYILGGRSLERFCDRDVGGCVRYVRMAADGVTWGDLCIGAWVNLGLQLAWWLVRILTGF